MPELDEIFGVDIPKMKDLEPALPDPTEDEDEDLVPVVPHPLKTPGPGALEETWWLLDDERAEMSDIYEQAGRSLDKMFEQYKLYPINIQGQRRLFVARYDFPQHGEEIQHPDGKLEDVEVCIGFIDFMCGFPMQNPELMTVVGEWSSRKERVDAQEPEKGYPVPPLPQEFFEGYDKNRLLLNYFYLDEKQVQTMAADLEGEPKPEGLHWWIRINLKADQKYPVPGEFVALAGRQWCTLPWGEQESSPYLFSGNWMDTVYYTGAEIKAVDESGNFPVYQVEWRKHLYVVHPTDYAEYQAGDRVTILKRVPSKKPSQLWKDEDTKEFDEQEWVIAPIIFYGIRGTGDNQEDFV